MGRLQLHTADAGRRQLHAADRGMHELQHESQRPGLRQRYLRTERRQSSASHHQIGVGRYDRHQCRRRLGRAQHYVSPDTYCFCPAPMQVVAVPNYYADGGNTNNGYVMYVCECPQSRGNKAGRHIRRPGRGLPLPGRPARGAVAGIAAQSDRLDLPATGDLPQRTRNDRRQMRHGMRQPERGNDDERRVLRSQSGHIMRTVLPAGNDTRSDQRDLHSETGRAIGGHGTGRRTNFADATPTRRGRAFCFAAFLGVAAILIHSAAVEAQQPAPFTSPATRP